MRQGSGQQPQRRDQHGHHDRPQAQHRSLDCRILDGIPARAQLIDVFQHDDAGLDGNAKQRQKPYPGRNTKIGSRNQKRHRASHRRQRHARQDQQGPLEGLEHSVEDQEDQQDRKRQNRQQAALRALLVLVFAGPVDGIALWQLYAGTDFLDGLLDRAAEVTAAHAVFNRDVARISLAIDLRGPVQDLDVRQLRQRNAFAARRQEPDTLYSLFRIAVVRQIAKHEVVALFPVKHLGQRVAADGGLHGVLNIRDVDAVARGALAIHIKVQVGLANHAKDAKVFHAADRFHDSDNLVALRFKCLEVVAIDLDGQGAFYAAYGFFQVVRDWLREIPEHARNLFQLAVHCRNEPFLVLPENRPPLFFGFKVNEKFGIKKPGGVGAVVGSSDLRDDLRHFRKRAQNPAGLVCDSRALARPGAGRQSAAHPDRSLVQMRQEFRADDAAEGKEKSQGKQPASDGKCDRTMPNGPGNHATIASRQVHHYRVLPVLAVFAEQEGGQGRSDYHGKKQRSKQGKHHGPCHGLEQLPFHALQREDRQVSGNDDGDGVEDGPLHLARRRAHLLEDGALVLGVLAEVPDDVFHHDHRSVHDHAEIQRSEREQVRGNVPQIETDRGEKQREWNGQGHDERAPGVPEEDEEDNNHQHHAFAEVVQHGVSGVVDQVVAVQVRRDFHAFRQNLLVQPVHHVVDAFQRGCRVRPFA